MTTIPMLEKELEQAYKDIKYYKNRIERLNNQLQQKENKIEKLMELYTTEREVKDYYKNIINELEKDLEDMYYGRGKYHMDSDVIGIKDVLNKIQELKELINNEKI